MEQIQQRRIEDYKIYEEKFASIMDKLTKDPAAMQAFLENPKTTLEQAGIPSVENLITKYQSAQMPATRFFNEDQPPEITVDRSWWGLTFTMNETLTQNIINNQIPVEALGALIAGGLIIVGIAEGIATVVGAAFAALLIIKYFELGIADHGNGVYWPITWLQWGAFVYPPYDPLTIETKAAVLIHPFPN